MQLSLVRRGCAMVYHIWSVRRLWPNICLKHLVQGRRPISVSFPGAGNEASCLLAASSARSALLMPADFSILPASCGESTGQGNCQDRDGELDRHRVTGYTRTGYIGQA